MQAFSGPHGTGVGPVGLAPGQAEAAIPRHLTSRYLVPLSPTVLLPCTVRVYYRYGSDSEEIC